MTTDTPKERQDRLSRAEQTECARCGETLVRVNATGDPGKDFVEKANLTEHACWSALPPNAEHLRLD